MKAKESYKGDLVVLSPKRLMVREERLACLRLVCRCFGDDALYKFGSVEPLRNRGFCENHEAVIREWDQWDHSLYWKRDKSSLSGSLYSAFRSYFQHSGVDVFALDVLKDLALLEAALETISTDVWADYAVLHVLGPMDLERGNHAGSGVVSFLSAKEWDAILYPTSERLLAGLPDVYWSQVFGVPYVELIGRQRIMSCPDADVRELPYGGIRVKSRLSILSARKEPEAFENWREAVKIHFGREFFFGGDSSENAVRTPNFCWRE